MVVSRPDKETKLKLQVSYIFNCDNCGKFINTPQRIFCPECNSDICLQCFKEKISFAHHSAAHPFQIVSELKYPIFSDNWHADEEILLIEGSEMFGIGNWLGIADFVGTKSPEECRRHFYEVYLESDYIKHLSATLEPYGFSAASSALDLDTQPETPVPVQSNPANHHIAGYMPKRNEFEHDFDNDAENAIKDLDFGDADTEAEKAIKYILLESYTRIQTERARRTAFASDSGILDWRQHQNNLRRLSKTEKEMLAKYKHFAPLLSKDDFNDFFTGMVQENCLRKAIVKLQEYKIANVQRLRDIFAAEKKREHASPVQSLAKIGRTGQDAQCKASDKCSDASASSLSLNSARSSSFKSGNSFDLSDDECVHALSCQERDLCILLRIKPKVYLAIKESLILEQQRQGFIKRAQARSMIKIDVNKTSRIYDHFIAAGWITSKK